MNSAITHIKAVALIIFLSLGLCSCEEKIKVNLGEGQPNVVIEGSVTNSKGPLTVRLSKSQAYYNQSAAAGIEKAVVQMSDSTLSETLVDIGSGYYMTKTIRGLVGDTYHLKVSTGGQNFSASVKLPPPVVIDTVYFKTALIDKDSLNVFIEFNDQRLVNNYYRVKLFRNGLVAVNDYYLISDAFSDGLRILAPFYYREFAPGDTVVVELDNLELSTWNYFKGLSEIIQGGVNLQAPGNPVSNITGGALGYFGAWGAYHYRIIIPK